MNASRPRGGFDLVLFVTFLLLTAIGLMMVLSASGPVELDGRMEPLHFLRRQVLGLVVGVVGGIGVLVLPYRWLRGYAPAVFLAALLGNLLVLVPGLRKVTRDAARWIELGGLRVQPSEFLKPALVLMFAAYLAYQSREALRGWRPVLAVGGMLAVAVGLLGLQGDMGTAVLVVGLSGLLLALAGVPPGRLAALGVAALAGLGVLLVAEPSRIARLRSWLEGVHDFQDAHYQVGWSLAAYFRGGFAGRGPGASQAKQLFLPDGWTDFISAVLAEEWGLVGILVLLALYALVAWRGLRIARHAPDRFGQLAAAGITAMVVLQAFVNLGVAMAILPNKGIVLPFISYGPSAMMAMVLAVAVLLRIGLADDDDAGPPIIVPETGVAA